MSTGDGTHLTPERITASLVDRDDLLPRERDHLEHCTECSRAREILSRQLQALSDNAGRFTPASGMKVRLPAYEPARNRGRVFKWSMGIAATAASAALVLALLLPQFFPAQSPRTTEAGLAGQLAQDEQLTAEVQQLADNPLSAAYAEILPYSDSDTDDDSFDITLPGETPQGMQNGTDIEGERI
jgi:hypothetical protein